MATLLPVVNDRKHYGELFAQDAIWEQSVQYLADKHRLSGVPRRGVRGSHVVYQVGNSWIKIMAPLFAKDMVFEVAGLKCIEGRLSVEAPRILAQGMLVGASVAPKGPKDGLSVFRPLRTVVSAFWASKATLAGT